MWIIDLITGGAILIAGGSTAWWIRKRVCKCYHGSGVILLGECTCGGSYLSGHEQYCGVEWCPKGCKLVATKAQALAIWARYQ